MDSSKGNVGDRAGHDDAIGDDVVANAAVDGGHGNDRWTRREVGLTTDDGLQPEDDLRRNDDRVDAVPGHGTMSLPSVDDDAQGAAGRHERAGPVHDATDGVGKDVNAEDGCGFRIV